eukprot:CAMPEP_0119522046 /NCGR_PEP_ID=MMETSP1344-20130328/37553_1 /TAXON_ID=236787 /ORGANISM="Florenciella parvula, Strain CCMP2471" /LENGTH=64 /DNA_ID=CAMNT_0007560065 /DNA_START=15 /DNA_END=206 /DNA_ORIENTATION=+
MVHVVDSIKPDSLAADGRTSTRAEAINPPEHHFWMAVHAAVSLDSQHRLRDAGLMRRVADNAVR